MAGNKSKFDLNNTNFDLTYDIDQIIKDQGEFRKFVFGCQANNEFLPFADASFGAYIANLSLMLVDDHKKMLKEAYRVLEPGSAATFTIWGRREHCLQFTLINNEIEKFEAKKGLTKSAESRSAFHLWDDQGEQVKKDLEEAGFGSIKMWQ